MKEKYNIRDAKQFSDEFENIQNLNEVDYIKLAKSLKIFAEQGQDVYFKRTVNKYVQLAEVYRGGIIEKNPAGKLEIGPNTYEFLEFLCSGADHIYTRNFFYNLRKRYVKEGRLTRMLKNNYAAMEDIENLERLEGD